MTRKEKFLTLVSPANDETLQAIQFRRENSLWLRESGRIAVKVLLALKKQGLSQKDLSNQMSVSPQYINKLVKGRENLTLETIVKLQDILQIEILVSSVKKEGNLSVAYNYQTNYIQSDYTSAPCMVPALIQVHVELQEQYPENEFISSNQLSA